MIDDDFLLEGILDDYICEIYNLDGELCGLYLIDINFGNKECGICFIFYVCYFDGEIVYFLLNLIENLFLSNGMSVGNNFVEVKV